MLYAVLKHKLSKQYLICPKNISGLMVRYDVVGYYSAEHLNKCYKALKSAKLI